MESKFVPIVAGIVFFLMMSCSLCMGAVVIFGPMLRPTLTRDEIKAKVRGKSPDEVQKILGTPNFKLITVVGRSETWDYDRIARDPRTGAFDATTTITFEQGKVVKVQP